MSLPETQAKSVEERRNEIVGTKDDEFLRIVSYGTYDSFPEIKPYKGRPENIRFLKDGVESLIEVTNSDRVVGSTRTLEGSPIDTTYVFHLIDENARRILKYSIDAIKDEY